MKKLIFTLFIFLFIITSSQKSALVGTWKAPNGSLVRVSHSQITIGGKAYPYRYLSHNSLLIVKNGKPFKTDYLLSFDKNTLTIFKKSYFRSTTIFNRGQTGR